MHKGSEQHFCFSSIVETFIKLKRGFCRPPLVSPWIFLFTWTFFACSTASQKASKDLSHIQIIHLLGTNDLHAALAPSYRSSIGGFARLSGYLKILQRQYQESLVWLDAGGHLYGNFLSDAELGEPIIDFMNRYGLKASAVGNHELNFGIQRFQERLQQAHYPYLAANWIDETTGLTPALPNLFPSTLLKVQNLQIGVIGLMTQETQLNTHSKVISHTRFESLALKTLQESKRLRELGAQIIVLLAHAGDQKQKPTSFQTSSIQEFKGLYQSKNLVQLTQKSPYDFEILHLLESLPKNTVDAVISGHTHALITEWIHGVPVIQSGSNGHYLNLIHLSYDWSQQKVVHSQIEGPIPICSEVDPKTQSCIGLKPSQAQVNANFHGQKVIPDPSVESWILELRQKHLSELNTPVAFSEKKLIHSRKDESLLGNFIADALKEEAKSDFAIVNAGGIRGFLPQGPITLETIHHIYPFDNSLSVLKIRGKDLLTLLKFSQTDHHGTPSVSGLRVYMAKPQEPHQLETIFSFFPSRLGQKKAFKMRHSLVSAELSQGQSIDPGRFYTLAMPNFMVDGGDFGQIFENYPASWIQRKPEILIRDCIVHHLLKNPSHDSTLQQRILNVATQEFKTKLKPSSRKRHSKIRKL